MPLSPKALEALVEFRKDVGAIHKGATADAGKFSYNYVEINALLDAIEEPLTKHGFTITQVLGNVDGKPSLATTLWHKEGNAEVSSVSGEVPLVYAPNDPQQFGASCTYFRRYGIITILGLQTEDNDAAPKAAGSPAPAGATSASSPSAPRQANRPASTSASGGRKQGNINGALFFKARDNGFNSDELAQRFFQTNSSKDLTREQCKTILDWIDSGAPAEAAQVIQQGFGTTEEVF